MLIFVVVVVDILVIHFLSPFSSESFPFSFSFSFSFFLPVNHFVP